MWKCRYCKVEFNFSATSEKANHSRWCYHNPKRNDWDKTKGAISQFGKLKDFEVECLCCSNKFLVTEREKLHSKWSEEMVTLIDKLIKEKWGIGASGNTLPLQGRVKGSTPLSSTIN